MPSFHDRLTSFLESRANLSPVDIPLVLTSFVVIKGFTALTCLTVGMKFKPVRYGFKRVGMGIKNRVVKTNVCKPSETGGKNGARKMILKLEKGRKDFNDGRQYTKKPPSIEPPVEVEQIITNTAQLNESSYLYRLGSIYLRLSQKFISLLSSSPYYIKLTKLLRIKDPREFALGMAEGAIIYKGTFMVHVPLGLYGCVKAVQVYRSKYPRLIEDEVPKIEEAEEKVDEEEEISNKLKKQKQNEILNLKKIEQTMGQKIGAEVSELYDLADMLYNEDEDDEEEVVVDMS